MTDREESDEDRVALGRALGARAVDVGNAVNERLRSILKLGTGEPLPAVNAARTSELATTIVARYLESGASASVDESRTLARPGSLALYETSMATLVKLFLAWRDVTLQELRDIGTELATPSPVLHQAAEVVHASCDASLVRMMKRFDERRVELERLLVEERGRLLHEASHDPLTGLVNRGAFLEMVRHASESHAPGEVIALMYIDLDGFKVINDTYGHDFGDVVLKAVAERLNELLRPGDTAGRIGGDEFVVLCCELTGGSDAAVAVAERLCEALSRSIVVEGRTVTCPASVGLVCSSGPTDPAALLSRADSALYSAKRAGKARVALG